MRFLRPKHSNTRIGWFFLIPALSAIGILVLMPTVWAVGMSMFKGKVSDPFEAFVGIKNYVALFQEPRVLDSMGRTVIFAVSVVVLILILGMSMALVLNRSFRMRKLFRTLVLFPWVVSGVVAGLTWRWILNAQYGLVNDLLMRLNLISKPIEWLSNVDLALPSVIIATAWRSYPLVMIMLLAGLQTIDRSLYESAQLDGANAFQQFYRITLPALRPISMPLILTQLIWQLQNYDLIASMSGQGPVYSTEVMSLYIYNTAFNYFDFNTASAMGVVLLVLTLIISIFYVRYYFQSLK